MMNGLIKRVSKRRVIVVPHPREVVIIRRRGAEDVALITAKELSGLLETAHLLRSPRMLNGSCRHSPVPNVVHALPAVS